MRATAHARAVFPLLVIFASSASAGQQQDVADLVSRAKPVCEMASLVARPADGWHSVPFEAPPTGHRGCQMLRVNDADQLVGILRVRSATAPTDAFTEEGYARLLANEVSAVEAMGVVFDETPLWVRNEVPVTGAGFREGRAVGFPARIESSGLAQEVHFLVFRADKAKYIFSLVTPAQAVEQAEYDRNVRDFGIVIRTLQPAP